MGTGRSEGAEGTVGSAGFKSDAGNSTDGTGDSVDARGIGISIEGVSVTTVAAGSFSVFDFRRLFFGGSAISNRAA